MSQTCLANSNCDGYTSGPVGQLFTSSIQYLFAAQCLLNVNWPEDATDTLSDFDFDYIVIGAGSAGSIVAARLSEDSCKNVLLVEAGGLPPLESNVISFSPLSLKTASDWQYKTENDTKACKGFVGGRCNWPRGKTLGGSGALNGMLYVRGHCKNYDDLQAAGNDGWNCSEALKYFKKSENLVEPDIKNDPYYRYFHGYDGLMEISSFHGTNPLRPAIIKAYEEIGSKKVEDISNLKNYGTVELLGNIKDGMRESSARAFLVPYRNKPNLKVMINTLATKIVFEGKTATGVVLSLRNGTEIIVKASKEIILSGGAINTPQLLMLSGVGPKGHLINNNIPVIADLAVGQNLHDHLALPVHITLNKGAPIESIEETSLNVAKLVTSRNGPFTENLLLDLTMFTNTESKDKSYPPDIQLLHLYFRRESTGFKTYCKNIQEFNDQICNSLINYNKEYELIVGLVTLLSPISRGFIELGSTDPKMPPKIYPKYLSEDEDLVKLIKGANIFQRFVNTESLKKINTNIERVNVTECNDFKFKSKDYWGCIAFNMAGTLYHPMGTAKMGPATDKSAVVDPYLRVHGLKNLRVIDASIFPGHISGNTNAPSMMVGEKGADMIKQQHNKDNKC